MLAMLVLCGGMAMYFLVKDEAPVAATTSSPAYRVDYNDIHPPTNTYDSYDAPAIDDATNAPSETASSDVVAGPPYNYNSSYVPPAPAYTEPAVVPAYSPPAYTPPVESAPTYDPSATRIAELQAAIAADEAKLADLDFRIGGLEVTDGMSQFGENNAENNGQELAFRAFSILSRLGKQGMINERQQVQARLDAYRAELSQLQSAPVRNDPLIPPPPPANGPITFR
jgi:hypothetical protein